MSEEQNPSIIQAQEVVEALLAGGVRWFAYCPGSRNAPFAYVLSAQERAGLIRVYSFAQESTAAFWALGVAKALGDGRPVAVFTTSGSAVSQMHAALEEARHQSLPVIAVTADRPFEMVGVGASQTTRQAGIFGPTLVADLDIPAESGRGLSQRVTRVLRRATGYRGRPGPAHINVAFRDPLTPARPIAVTEKHYEHPAAPTLFTAAPPWSRVVDRRLNTLVIAGDCEPADLPVARAIGAHASKLGIPILAEPSSNLTTQKTWVPHGPLVAPLVKAGLEQLIVLGKPTLSRPVAALLAKEGVRKVVVSPHEEWPDTVGNAAEVVHALEIDTELKHDLNWLNTCREASAQASLVLGEVEGALNHLSAARAIWEANPEISLWLGASNTVRAFDLAANNPGREGVFSNRGLAGIDGTIAAAMGAQTATGRPLRAVMGDLTFLYDLPALGSVQSRQPHGSPQRDLQIIVLDDGGGTIFESLEHGRAADLETLERYFAVPQEVDVCAVASAFGWEVTCIHSLSELTAALVQPVRGLSVLHVSLSSPADLFEAVRSGGVAWGKLRKS